MQHISVGEDTRKRSFLPLYCIFKRCPRTPNTFENDDEQTLSPHSPLPCLRRNTGRVMNILINMTLVGLSCRQTYAGIAGRDGLSLTDDVDMGCLGCHVYEQLRYSPIASLTYVAWGQHLAGSFRELQGVIVIAECGSFDVLPYVQPETSY